MDIGRYTITAQNAYGELVFAKLFTHESLQRVDDLVEKAVIPGDTPLRGADSIDLTVENKSDMILDISINWENFGDVRSQMVL